MIHWPRDYVGQILHVVHYFLAAGPLVWLWWWGWPGSAIVWFMHEMTQARAKEIAEVKTRNALEIARREKLMYAGDPPLYAYVPEKPRSLWWLFKSFGHRRYFDATGYLLGGTLVSAMRYFL